MSEVRCARCGWFPSAHGAGKFVVSGATACDDYVPEPREKEHPEPHRYTLAEAREIIAGEAERESEESVAADQWAEAEHFRRVARWIRRPR